MSQLAPPARTAASLVSTGPLAGAGADTERRNDSLPSGIVPGTPRSPRSLAGIARHLAGQAEVWRPLLHVDPDRRWYIRLSTGDGWEAWLLTWLPGQGTDLHDHGGSSGAFTVLQGELQELTPAPVEGDPARLASRVLRAPQVRAFGPRHVHQVLGVGDTAAASLHVYAPALTVMNRYRLDPVHGPVIAETDRAGSDW
jgi:hypothetical protein